jgi:Skp family chaperone for outer membrane proteins
MDLRTVALALAWGTALAGPAVAGPRIATVDATKLFADYSVTRQAQEKLKTEREALKDDPRLKVINQTIAELGELRSQIRNEDLPEESREDYYRKFQMKAHELRSLQRDTLQHLEDQKEELNARMVGRTREILAEIQVVIREYAEKNGYDVVIETGGNTSSQVPCLLYIRNGTDITGPVLEVLNKGANESAAAAGNR